MVNLSILGELWEEEPKAAEQEAPIEPIREEPKAEAPRNLYALSEEQQAYINRTKAEILEKVYTVDDTTSLLLKAIGVMAICLNDKAYYSQVARLIKNVWGQGLGKIGTLDEIPQAFVLGELERYLKITGEKLKERSLDADARADIETARAKMKDKGKKIYNAMPEAAKLNFNEEWIIPTH